MAPALFIVSVYRPDLYEAALQAVGCAQDVQVILDRRVGERRGPHRSPDATSSENDRRRLAIEEQLRTQGWVLVTAEEREELDLGQLR
jgi:hypothetical protein